MQRFGRRLYPFLRSFSTCSGPRSQQQKSSRVLSIGCASLVALSGVTLSSYLSLSDSNNGSFSYPLSATFIADAADIIAPSVVNIVAKSSGFLPSGSAGSGFIVSNDGFIATNAHVVKMVKVGGIVDVTLANGRKFPGRVWSMDESSDIALVKLDTSGRAARNEVANLPVARIGDSSILRAGEFVVAVGSPMQLMNSVSFGIVSAPARQSSELGLGNLNFSLHDFIQTDASINVGNSGGPLVNLKGEVIGINFMKAQGMDGVSFAIPMETAWAIIQQLMTKPNVKVSRPYVGLRMVNFKPARRMSSWLNRGIDDNQIQVLVTEVKPDSPAEKAGLKMHDVIVNVNGKEVTNTSDVIASIGWEFGKSINIQVRREHVGDVELSLITEKKV